MRTACTVAVFALLALAGCGEDSDDPQEPAPTTGPSVAEPDARLCPELGGRKEDAELRERAELALVGLPLAEAEDLAEAAGCHVAPISIDGEAQILTREYDPTRIQVAVRDGVVREVSGFG